MLFLARDALLVVYVSGLGAIERHRPAAPRRLPRWAAILIIYVTILSVLTAIAIAVIPPLVMQARDLWATLPTLLHRVQQWVIDRGLLGRELTVGEAVQKTPVGGPDAVGAVIGAVW